MSEDSTGPSQHWRPLRLPSGRAPEYLSAQVRQRLSVLDGVEKAITKERSDLHMVWNCTLPINLLPNELLVSIFAHVADGEWVTDHSAPLSRGLPSTKWTKLILVCRYWRDMAYASPKLWRVIHIRSLAYTERALALSSPSTIDVSFGHREPHTKVFQLLQPHTHRLRSVQFATILSAWKPAVLALLRGDGGMPALETIQLPFQVKTQESPDDDFVDLQLTLERYPRLRSLTVVLTVAPQDIQVYARLRKLSLRYCRCSFSFNHFLDALDASTSLDTLDLESVLQHIEGDWAGSGSIATHRNALSLHHLKSLRLIGHPPVYTYRFLSHILLSPTVSVWINSFSEDILGAVTEIVVTMLPSNPATVLPALALAKEAVVDADGPGYSLHGSCSPRGRGAHLMTFQFRPLSDFTQTDFSSHGARDLLRVFASAPLTTLDFTGDCGEVAAEVWAEIFNRYPLLEKLKLGHDGTTETVFAGLRNANPTPGSRVPCPRLQSVFILGSFSEAAIEVVLQCLRERAEKGHRLGSISIDVCGEDALRVMEITFIPRLREVVLDVDYDCHIW